MSRPPRRRVAGDPVPDYTLDPKEGIRLLTLYQRHSTSADIECSLQCHKLSEAPSFVALSYTCAAPTIRGVFSDMTDTPELRGVYCDGYRYRVAGNLFAALSQLSLEPTRQIWIDAMCIHQSDNDEKAKQVQLMGDIYANAEEVIAWIGDESPGIDDFEWTTTTFLNEITKLIEERGSTFVFDRAIIDADVNRKLNVEYIPRKLQAAADFISNRRWLVRAWILQEVALAKKLTVRCGSRSLSWSGIVKSEDLMLDASWIKSKSMRRDEEVSSEPHSIGGTTQQLASFRGMVLRYKNDGRLPPSLADFVRKCFGVQPGNTDMEQWAVLALCMAYVRPSSSSIPLDKIYSILGIMRRLYPNPPTNWISVDYGSSVRNVFLSATVKLLNHLPYLTILPYVEDHSDRRGLHNLPSWCPDYEANIFPFTIIPIRGAIGRGNNFNASGSTNNQSPGRFLVENTLALSGAPFDTIAKVCESTLFEMTSNHTILHGLQMCRSASIQGTRYVNGQSCIEALWRTIILDTDLNDVRPAPSSIKAAFCSFLEGELAISIAEAQRISRETGRESTIVDYLRSLLGDLSTQVTHGEIPAIHDILEYHRQGDSIQRTSGPHKQAAFEYIAARDAVSNPFRQALTAPSKTKRVFLTSKGFIGLGPASSRIDDKVWMIQDALVPFVLRPINSSDPEGLHSLVGESYLHGFMDGEMLDEKWDLKNNIRQVCLV